MLEVERLLVKIGGRGFLERRKGWFYRNGKIYNRANTSYKVLIAIY